jgi:hypothetical protein
MKLALEMHMHQQLDCCRRHYLQAELSRLFLVPGLSNTLLLWVVMVTHLQVAGQRQSMLLYANLQFCTCHSIRTRMNSQVCADDWKNCPSSSKTVPCNRQLAIARCISTLLTMRADLGLDRMISQIDTHSSAIKLLILIGTMYTTDVNTI